jgi:hypothetical protein
MSDTKAFDSWVKDALGMDVAELRARGRSSQAPGAGSAGDATAAPPGASATGEGEDQPAGDDKPGGDTPGTTPPIGDAPVEPSGAGDTPPPTPVKLVLKSETEVTKPGNRARTKLGVGERVTLTLTPVAGDWTATGAGTVKPKKGSTVVLTASGSPGKVKVSVTAAGQTEEIEFTVIAPNSVHQDTVSTEHYNVGVPNAGFKGRVYCGPDDVNFVNITFLEAEIGCVATGSWIAKNGKGHGPNTSPIGFGDTVVSGKGTMSDAVDHCWSGYVPGLTLTDWTGEMTFSIPWTYQCNGAHGKIDTVVQKTSTSKDGTTSTKKAGGSSGDFALS